MAHPESKSGRTFSNFPLLLAPWGRQIFKTGDHRSQNCANISRCAFAVRLSCVSIVLNKVLVRIVLGNFEISAPEYWWGPKKVPNFFFDADFGGFAGILRLWSKLQKVIILEALGAGFKILGKSLTPFEISEKGYFTPWGNY